MAEIRQVIFENEAYFWDRPAAREKMLVRFFLNVLTELGFTAKIKSRYNFVEQKVILTAKVDRKFGKWGKENECSVCGCKPWFAHDIHTLNFCPNCGTDMRDEFK